MAEARPYKRQLRNYLINKPLQREYTTLMIGVMIFSTLVVSGIIHTTMKQAFLGHPYRIGQVSPYQVLAAVNEKLTMRVSAAMLFFIFCTTLLGIVSLHRVAGPVYRFRMLLKKVSAGQIPSDVTLRQGDYFKDVAEEFNEVFKHLREKKTLAAQILTELDRIPREALPEPVVHALGRVRGNLEKL